MTTTHADAVEAAPAGAAVLFEERVPTGPLARAVLLGAAATLIGAGWVASPGESLLARTFFRLFTLGAAVVIIAMGWRIHEMAVRITKTCLRLEQGHYTREIPMAEIDHAEAAMAGRGHVRIPGRGNVFEAVYCVNRRGPAVVLYRRDGPPIAFSSRSPHGAVEAVDEAVRAQRSAEVLPALRANEVIVLEAVH